MGTLDGKVALVTGAGGGLGRSHALLLAREGAAVVVNDLGGTRDGSGSGSAMADTVVGEIVAAGGRAVANYDSVSESAGAERMVAQAVEAFGRLDILVANAGILRDKTFAKMDGAMWDAVIAVHLQGTYYCVRAAYQQMLAQGEGGRIIMTSSTSGLYGNFGQCNYGAAKAGIAGFARCLWPEAQRKGITVNVLAPAALTRMTEDLPIFSQSGGFGETMKPENVSPVVAFLASPEAESITGRVFLVFGNTVKLIEPTAIPIAARGDAAPWEPAAIGKKILEVVAGRKHPAWFETV